MNIKRTAEDEEALKEIMAHGVTKSKLEHFDFHGTAIVKPWGYEYLAYETNSPISICAWVLHMKNNGTGTSLHCHATKRTLIHVLEGRIWVKTLNDSFELSADEEMWIDKATFHAMGALEDNTVLVEIENPSFKPDALRYRDTWDREYQEYESQCALVKISALNCPYLNTVFLADAIRVLTHKAAFAWVAEDFL